MTHLRIPSATYRLQFNHQFAFRQAKEFVSYFQALGISDIYSSPIMQAAKDSIHGYDVLDPTQINREIGSESDFNDFIQVLKQANLGFILDIVPDHLCINGENRWWEDVLENGPSSLYAAYFNIIWDPPKPELKNKVLLAVLDQQFGKIIESQGFNVVYEEGAFFVEYQTRRFPLNPFTWQVILKPAVEILKQCLGEEQPQLLELESIVTALEHLPKTREKQIEKCKERAREKEIIKKRLATLTEQSEEIKQQILDSIKDLNGHKGNPHSFDRLEELLNEQPYRLSFWRVTNDEINYRRFFDVNELVSMQSENEEVFEAMHALVFDLIRSEKVTGLRIDHVDGLFDPEQYFSRLQKKYGEVFHVNGEEKNFFVVIEKILLGDEKLKENWKIFGTTGYDFLNLLNGLFVVKNHWPTIRQMYERFINRHFEVSEIVFQCKKLILLISMASELHILSRQLEKVSKQHRWSRDFTLESLRSALRDIIACFPVYRTYIRKIDEKIETEDRKYIEEAIREAKRINPASDPSIFEFIENVLLLDDPPGLTEEEISFRRDFVFRFQQLTGPVAAKGEEDTAFYRYYPLASLNEVGMDLDRFGTTIEEFHLQNKERLDKWPHTFLATSTHDTKRSEDVRARINILSEIPEEWNTALYKWKELNHSKKTVTEKNEIPDANEEYLIYQTLIGTWPLYPMDATARAHYIGRIEKYILKAIKEAKIHTSWVNPHVPYEQGVLEFIHRILDLEPSNQFLKEFEGFVQPIMKAGLYHSLSQLVLKMTVPGIPDFYQGSELWCFDLVDPDNRHSVDYSTRSNLLNILKQKGEEDTLGLVKHLMETPEDGRIKLYVTSKTLNFRLKHSELFQKGSYVPIEIKGTNKEHIIAFFREYEGKKIMIIVGRFLFHFIGNKTVPLENIWNETSLMLTPDLEGEYCDILTGQKISLNQEISLEKLFSNLPLVILTNF